MGFQFDKYNKGSQCWEYSAYAMDTFFGFNDAMQQRFYWYEPVNYAAQKLAKDINNAWYDCWQFKEDFKADWIEKKSLFVDGADVYLSFMFNLLGNSWQLKVAGESMSIA